MVETPGPEAILSIVNINKARFLGSFRVVVSHQVLLQYLPLETTPVVMHIFVFSELLSLLGMWQFLLR